jgi:hypothetical protein
LLLELDKMCKEKKQVIAQLRERLNNAEDDREVDYGLIDFVVVPRAINED